MTIALSLFSYSGVGISFFLILLLIQEVKKNPSKIFLVGTLIAYLPIFLAYLSFYENDASFVRIMMPLLCIGLYFLAPFVYEYVISLYHSKKTIKAQFNKNFYVPFLATLILLCSHLFIESAETQLLVLIILMVGAMIQFCYFIFKISQVKNKFQKLLANHLASFSKVDLNWVNLWLYGLLIFIIIDLCTSILIAAVPSFRFLLYFNVVYLLLLIVAIGYYGIQQTHVFISSPISDFDLKDDNKPSLETEPQFDCNDLAFQQLKQKLQHVFVEEEAYKIENLNLSALANRIGTSDKKISFFLNQCMKTNFYEYVNQFRFREFERRIRKGEGLDKTLLSVAYASGFNSKSTFNRVVKQKTSMTPKQYVKSLKIE